MSRYGWLLAGVFLLSAAPGLARTWTDNQGRQVEGEFVRVLKGKVVLSVDGRVMMVPFVGLIDSDQEFVRKQLEARGQGSFLPARKHSPKSESLDPKPADGTEPVGEKRTWTDTAGHKVQATFVDVENGKVVLQLQGKRSSFPFEKFSVEDQKYVRGEMQSRGEGDKLPDIAQQDNPRPPDVRPPQPAPQVVRSFPPIQRPGAPRITFPAVNFPPPAINFPPPVVNSPPPGINFPPVTPPTVVAPLPPLPVVAQDSPPLFSSNPSPAPPASPFGERVMVKCCQKCGKAVPNNLTAGDTCPHCGVYFQFEDDGSGIKKTAPVSWKSFVNSGGITAVVIVIVGVIVRLYAASR